MTDQSISLLLFEYFADLRLLRKAFEVALSLWNGIAQKILYLTSPDNNHPLHQRLGTVFAAKAFFDILPLYEKLKFVIMTLE